MQICRLWFLLDEDNSRKKDAKKWAKTKPWNAGCMHKRCLTIIRIFSCSRPVLLFLFFLFHFHHLSISIDESCRSTAEFYYLFFLSQRFVPLWGKISDDPNSIREKNKHKHIATVQNGIGKPNQYDQLAENNLFWRKKWTNREKRRKNVGFNRRLIRFFYSFICPCGNNARSIFGHRFWYIETHWEYSEVEHTLSLSHFTAFLLSDSLGFCAAPQSTKGEKSVWCPET